MLTIAVATLIVGNVQRTRVVARQQMLIDQGVSFGPTDSPAPQTSRGLRFQGHQALWMQLQDSSDDHGFVLRFNLRLESFRQVQFRLAGPNGSVNFAWEAERDQSPALHTPLPVTLEVRPEAARLLLDDKEIETIANPPLPFKEMELVDYDSRFYMTDLRIESPAGEPILILPLAVVPATLSSKLLAVLSLALLMIALARLRAWRTPEKRSMHLRRLLFASTPLWGGMLLPIGMPLDKLILLLIVLSLAIWLLPRRPLFLGLIAGFLLIYSIVAEAGGLPVALLLVAVLLVWQFVAYRGRRSHLYIPAMLALAVLFIATLELDARYSSFNDRWQPRQVGKDFLPDDLLFYAPRDLFTDNQGFGIGRLRFRGGEATLDPPPGTTRIMVLGGSNAWGQHLGSNAETFSGLLERCLHEALPERRFEVLNAGVRGYNLFQLVVLFQHYGLAYQPTILILYLNFNDASEHYGPFTYRQLWQMKNEGRWAEVEAVRPAPTQPPAWIAVVQNILQRSRLYNGLVLLITGGRRNEPPRWLWNVVQDANPVSDYRLNLEEMINLCRAHGIRPLLVDEFDIGYSLVDPQSKVVTVRQAMKEIAAAQGVDYLPLNEIFHARPDRQELVFPFDEVHLNPQGHQAVGEELCRYLLDRRLFGAMEKTP